MKNFVKQVAKYGRTPDLWG